MKRYKAKKIKIPWYMTKTCLVIQIIILIFLLRGLMSIAAKRSTAIDKYQMIQEEYETVQESHRDLGGRVELLRTQYGEESVLRQTWGVVRPEEKVYTIIEPDEPEKKLLPLPSKKTWWEKIWYGE